MPPSKWLLVFVGAAATSALTPGGAHAVPSDARAIQRMVDSAPPGATLSLPAGRISGHLRVTKPITLLGRGPNRTIFMSTGRRAALMVDSKEGQISLQGMKFTTARNAERTRGAGVMIGGPGEIVLKDIVIERSIAGPCLSSAIALQRAPKVQFIESKIIGHRCYMAGAMVIPTGAEVTLDHCMVSDNHGQLAGAVYVSRGGRLNVVRSTFERNRFVRGNDGHHLLVGPGVSWIELSSTSIRTDMRSSIGFEVGAEPSISLRGMRWPEPSIPPFVRTR